MAANRNQIVNIPQGFFDSKEEATEVISSIRNPQDEDDRRRIRENYRKLQDDLLERRREMIDPSDEQNLLKENVFKVDQMFKEVQMTREGALDSASLANISELGKAKAQALKTDFIQFNPVDFCEKVKVIIAGDVDQQGLSYENWKTLGKAVFPFFKRTPVLKYMCGTFERGDVNLKRAKPTREKEKENVLSQKASKPTQLSSFEDTDRGELTTAHVEHILSTLWRYYDEIKAPLCYFEFVTNPHSFGQTVENIFYTSFLVRDGHASVTLDTDDLPVIEPIQKAEGGANHEQTHKQQIIISITPAEWEEIVKTFEIHTPMIESLKRTEASSRPSTVTNSPEIPVYHGKGKGKGKKNNT